MFKLSEKEKAMHAYIRLIAMKSLPIICVADPEFRSFCKYNVNFFPQLLKRI